LGGQASERDASGGGRREYHYRNSLEEDVSIITETASLFFTQGSIAQRFKPNRPSRKGTVIFFVFRIMKAIMIISVQLIAQASRLCGRANLTKLARSDKGKREWTRALGNNACENSFSVHEMQNAA